MQERPTAVNADCSGKTESLGLNVGFSVINACRKSSIVTCNDVYTFPRINQNRRLTIQNSMTTSGSRAEP